MTKRQKRKNKGGSAGSQRSPQQRSSSPQQQPRSAANQSPSSSGNSELRVRREEYFSGPLPPPEILSGYEQIEQGLASRIVSMAEREQSHTHAMDRRLLRNEYLSDHAGRIAAVVVAVLFLAGSVWLIDRGHAWPGLALGTIDLAALVSVFIYGKRSETQSRR